MPRTARIDYPGALHHIMVRGIERRSIFMDDIDRNAFVERLDKVLTKTETACFAWALMPNHFHLLVSSGIKPLSTVMQSLLTSYALYFNKRHNRIGRLYQNRYKSILCNKDEYFLELVRYIHLNPIRGKIVKDLQILSNYLWCGHSALIGNDYISWQNTDAVLCHFGSVKAYIKFIEDGLEEDYGDKFSGGGLVRSAGGLWELYKQRKAGIRVLGDERILGDGDFVEEVLNYTDEQIAKRDKLKQSGITFETVVTKAANLMNIDVNEIGQRNKHHHITMARSIACTWLVDELGVKQIDIARKFGVSSQTISGCVLRGREIIAKKGFVLN